MLPCVRCCIGKKVNPLPAVCADLCTNKPLLFLYPSWFRDASKHASQDRLSRNRKFSTLPNRRTPTAAATKEAEEQISYSTGPGDRETAGRRSQAASSLGSRCSGEQHNGHIPLPRVLAAPARRPFVQSTPKTLRQEYTRNNLNTSQDKKISTYKKTPSETASRVVLKLARKLSKIQQSDADDQQQLLLEADFLEWLTGTSGENMWKHHDGSGCLVHIRVRSADDQRERRVVLTGTARAREIAAMHLKALEEEYHKSHTESDKDKQKISKSKTDTYTIVDRLPRPHPWSVRTFSDYVGAVVTSQVPKGIERVLYSSDQTFNQAVAQTLVKTFTDPELSPFLSSFALRQALAFLCSRTDVAFAATAIWRAVKSADIVPDVNCFNHEISRCIRVGNVAGVKRLVNEMRVANVQPDVATWAHLFKLISGKQHQSQFFNLLPLDNIGHDQMLAEMIIQCRIDDEFEPSDEEPMSVLGFKDKMQQDFGDHWLTPSIARRMIERCLSINALRAVSSVLTIASSLSMRSDPASFDTILKAVAQTGWFADVLTLLQTQSRNAELLLNEPQIETLFEAAWKQRLVNTARVLWHYAASHGSIRYSMMTKVSQEVAQNVHPTADANPRLTAWMAAMTVGTDLAVTSSDASGIDQQHKCLLDMVNGLRTWTTDGELRHNQLQVVHILIERDITAWQRVNPIDYGMLINLLEQAHSMDMLWQDQKLILHRPFPDLMQQTIPIKLVLKTTDWSPPPKLSSANSGMNTRSSSLVNSNNGPDNAIKDTQFSQHETEKNNSVSILCQKHEPIRLSKCDGIGKFGRPNHSSM